MNIRMSNINSIADAIKTHPYMSKRQKDELLEHYNKAADETVKKAFAELSRRYEKELSAMALMTLRRDDGKCDKYDKGTIVISPRMAMPAARKYFDIDDVKINPEEFVDLNEIEVTG